MKIISYNVRGYNAPDKHRLIKRGLDQLWPDVVFLQETKLDNGEKKSLLGSWKQWSRAFVDSVGASGGLGILWHKNIHKVEEGLASNMWQGSGRGSLNHWGDLNAILELSDKLGGNGEIPTNLAHFQNFVTENGLREIKSKEGHFTWSNCRITGQHVAEKLDRCPFKFEKMWLRDQNLRDLINGWWSGAPEVSGTKAFIFVKKLQFIKSKLKEWNRVKFDNIFANKRELEDRLASLQEDIIQMGVTSEKFLQERELKGQYSELLAREEVFWRQKLRECWLKEGDRNIKFFHNSVKVKRSRNKIMSILNKENAELDKMDDINKEAVDFFLSLLSKDKDPELEQQQEGLNVIPKLITDAQN
ncbi:uncharacterized protein LOC131068907 [Cryptomeria japonica]|uniref:uncharacterized protein LOC131068907 n=1 Tax=Cryptomeria japonica TaxID=3369 RepID=UPI0027DA44D5|nr:uncharacterized protein LOC131068907 [Cryptomeria japonica]